MRGPGDRRRPEPVDRPSGSAGAKSGKSGGPGGEPARKDGLHEITYRITGSAERGMMTYSTPSGQEQVTKPVPWAKRFRAKAGEFLSISAQNEGSGTISCTITVDGKVIKRAKSSGEYTIAACDAMLGVG
ncbi:hypothetical protein [Actinomadura sp. J1-007]|uniref:hypothetical protein n=1 Tax=Actinomadura sp. J1-007 TaxID=2661913 RepID=UPI0013E03EC3|nr:hypothetical protein [Actinomadura sp. J1-007]